MKKKRKMKSDKKILDNINKFIEGNKFINDTKYHKNNVRLVAHFESDISRNGICTFCLGDSPLNSLYNKRKGKLFSIEAAISYQFCDSCLMKMKEIIGCDPYARTEWCP